jgi:hypothetical protein
MVASLGSLLHYPPQVSCPLFPCQQSTTHEGRLCVDQTSRLDVPLHHLPSPYTLQGPIVSSMGLNVTANGMLVVLRQQAQLNWRVVQLQPQLQPHVISLVSTTAGFFAQPQDCRVSIAAIVPQPAVSYHVHHGSSMPQFGKCAPLKARLLLGAPHRSTTGLDMSVVFQVGVVHCKSFRSVPLSKCADCSLFTAVEVWCDRFRLNGVDTPLVACCLDRSVGHLCTCCGSTLTSCHLPSHDQRMAALACIVLSAALWCCWLPLNCVRRQELDNSGAQGVAGLAQHMPPTPNHP